jgi:glycosyltransferase involved in cell wall biosynthesis
MVEMMSPRPRVLHLFSGWNWVEPACSIVDLCRRLGRHGHVVDLACARAPEGQPNALEQNARERHVDPILDFRLEKSFNPFVNLPDIHRLTEFLDREEVQIVHVHTAHDHYIGSRAARRANNQPSVVRTNHFGAPLPPTWRNRRVVRGHTDAWVALGPSCRDEDVRNFDLNPARAIAVEAAVDLERFNPAASRTDVRPALGLSSEHVVAGFVSNTGSGRSFELVMQAFAKAMPAEPLLRLLVIGRGMEPDSPAQRAARELGIADRAIFAGYRVVDYADYLAAMDFEIFLAPGSDGSCPVAREAMAMGKPVIGGRSGLLPELVEDGRCGLVVDEPAAEKLAEAVTRLARNRSLREKLGRAAAAKAKEKFDIERQAEAIADLYRRIAEGA